jgi:hypothetical protein
MVEEFTDASLRTPFSPRAPCSPHNTILKHSHGETKEVRLSYKYTNQICNLSLLLLCDDVFSLPVFNPKAFHFFTFWYDAANGFCAVETVSEWQPATLPQKIFSSIKPLQIQPSGAKQFPS